MAQKTHTVTYDSGPSGSVEVDSKVLPKGEPVPGITDGQLKRLIALDDHKFTNTETKEKT